MEDPWVQMDPFGLVHEVLSGGTLYREASGTNPSMTPRPHADVVPRAPAQHALLSFSTVQPSSGKFVAIDGAKLEGTGLIAVRDSASGHVSVFPVDSNGRCDLTRLREWADSRATGRDHELTEKLLGCRAG